MKKLTKKQKRILDLIIDRTNRTGIIQTCQSLGDYLKISKYGVYCHIQSLINKGFLFPSRGNFGLYPLKNSKGIQVKLLFMEIVLEE